MLRAATASASRPRTVSSRASTVMGMVGAGGIGFELMGSLRIMQYQEVAAILLVILAMVTLVDAFSGVLRKRFK